MSDKKSISEADLLLIANQIIQDHESYVEGMRATSVEEKDEVLVFKGEYFLSEQGLPTEKTTAVFNMFKYLAHQLSKEFSVK
ncbi:YciN family protein [Aliivibrio sp. S4TY2]|uniref:YciN family protein n=1 Tax=unclassified Aliivibrio TaxID=2645654 RepID=UPI0023790710|nr:MULTISPECIES: YciN family protein [unclassified Aliivibrio]MDD9158252.1 YciN family protein [Aliivibrio sp. S4TY2]MDD9162167.1 YciN family protein [Aliivibrio sp. S4TY1]MDD9166205.1 YciN family protein [Aliivibrio sp. S4MY2]MDD9170203.1 YciN family protein [Aliivibrio sp. S4MY4]MDD9187254.1 YciN family protein [Aliivibrio sp. S4MY3]